MVSQSPSRRRLKIAVLQAGTKHSHNGQNNGQTRNPGLEANFGRFAGLAREAAAAKPDLILFPEYAISGWPYPPEAVINGLAEPIPGDGPWYRRYAALAREIETALVGWLVESADGKRYTTAFLIDPQGHFVGKYRKVQANLGEQTWWGWSQGQSFAPIEYDGVRYGLSICADMWFPETVRCEELLGADLILHLSIADDMGHIIPTRAFDSEIPIVAAIFNGGSYAVDSRGNLLAKLPAETSGWHIFELDPFKVRTHAKYGGLWIPKLGHQNLRNLEAYQILLDPRTRPPWTEVFLDDEGNPQTRAELLTRFKGRYDANDPALYHQNLISFAPPWESPYSVDPARPFHLVNGQGNHLFIVNKAAWAYFACRYPEAILNRAKAQGVNVLRVALEGRPYFDHLGLEMWPWGGARNDPDWTSFNEAYWDEVETRIRLAGDRGIGFDLVIYFNLHPSAGEVEIQRAYWDYILSRLSKYANILTWEMANEYVANETFQDAAGPYFKARDPYNRPVCTSAGTTDDAIWPDKPWVDLAVNHTCTSSTEKHDLRNWYLVLAMNTRAHGKPAFCNESGRENRHKNDDGVHRRKQGWLWCTSGGFWTWHSWDGCEGIDDRDYQAPGEAFLKPMVDFFQTLPFWRMAPNFTSLRVRNDVFISATLAEPNRNTIITYICTPQTGPTVADAQAVLRLPNGQYSLNFINPVDLSLIEKRDHNAPGLGEETVVIVPAFQDDILIKIEQVQARRQTLIPGTR